MKTRIIHTKFWSDGYISELNRAEKIAFLYLITNERIGLSGIYELPDPKVIFETGLTQSEWDQVKDKFSKDGKFNFCKGWVKIINVDKYQAFLGAKNEIAKQNELNLINKDILDTLSIPYAYPLVDGEAIEDSLSNHKSIISNHKSITNKRDYSKIENVIEEDFIEIAIHMNNETDKFMAFIRSKYDDMVNWYEENPMKNKKANWKATLRAWVKQDAMKIRKEAMSGNPKKGIDARHL